jgi:formamidopyrimidine-DNA glycosylase
MPELPEVETVRRGLASAMEGRPIRRVHVMRPDLRIPFPEGFAGRLAGRTVQRLARRARYLLIECDDGTILIVHLGMSGRMVIDPPGGDSANAKLAPGGFVHNTTANGRHEHVVFELGDGTVVRFSDPRRFGLMTLTTAGELDLHPLIAHLGPEPTGEDFDGDRLGALLDGKRTPIKSALLDQRVVAGLGNIYVCESLFASGISPRRIAATVQGDRAARLARAIREVLAEAIAAGGSTLRDHVTPNGEIGYFQHRFKVYDREGRPCPGCDCGAGVRRIVQSGRSTFYCPKRQR